MVIYHKMNNPFDIFDKIYCVHLPQHTERLTLIKQEFDKFGMNDRVQYIHAKPPQGGFNISNMRRNPRAEFGVSLSQIKAIIRALHDNAQQPFFCEDDIQFTKNASHQLSEALTQLPNNWDILYFDGHPRGKHSSASRFSPNLAKVSKMSFASAYSIPRRNLLSFIDFWFDNIGKPKDAMFDFLLGDWASLHDAYCVHPLICSQRIGYSFIGGKTDDKTDLLKRGWKFHLGG